jgi:hypothetical protein
MKTRAMFSFLVHAGKGASEQPEISSTTIPDHARVWSVISRLFESAETDCEVAIAFTQGDAGEKRNPCRDELVAFLKAPSLATGHPLAARLQAVTTDRSGLGLFFLTYGDDRKDRKALLSRFPAEAGILADEQGGKLSIQYVERVFMKNWKTYKAAVYSGSSFDGDFWHGKAIDKQINDRATGLSDYWVEAFLLSKLRTPGRVGTKRFAMALKEAAKVAKTADVHDELAALSKLATKVKGAVSVNELLNRYGVEGAARNLIEDAFPNRALMEEKFNFDSQAYNEDLAYRTIQLDSGAFMTADTGRFDEIFKREKVRDKKNTYRYTTEGEIEVQRFKKATL